MKKIARLCAVMAAVLLAALLFTGCSQANNAAYKILDESLSDEQYAVGFRKADQALRDEVQKILCDMKKDGKLAEISKTWFGEDVTTVPENFTPAGATDDSLQKVKDKKTFVLGLDDTFPPMGYRNADNEIVGFDVDVYKEVCRRMGVEFKLQPIDWTGKDMELNNGKVDCLWNGFSIDEERKAAFNLSEPYMTNRMVVVTMEANGINSLADLKDKRVALQGGSTAVKALTSKTELVSTIKDGKPIELDNNVLALYDLKNGGCDAVVMDEVVAKYYIAHQAEIKAE